MLTGKTDARVQHGFSAMQNERKMGHGMRDDRNGVMRYITGKGFVHFDRRDVGRCKGTNCRANTLCGELQL